MIKIEKNNKSMIITITLISIFSIVFGLIYTIGYMPILGNIIAEKKLNDYISSKNENEIKIQTKYDWYDNKYESINNKGRQQFLIM